MHEVDLRREMYENNARQMTGVIVGGASSVATGVALAIEDVASWLSKTPPHHAGFILAAAAVVTPLAMRGIAEVVARNGKRRGWGGVKIVNSGFRM